MSTTTGDIGGDGWKRYDDPAEKAFKLNAERNNGGRLHDYSAHGMERR